MTDSNFNLPPDFVKQIAAMAEQINKFYYAQFNEQIQSIVKSTEQAVRELVKIDTDQIRRVIESVSGMARGADAHLPDNWASNFKAVDVCMMGAPIIFVPRAEIITKLVGKQDLTSVKRILVHAKNSPLIMDDCELAIAACTWLPKDMRDHIQESIDCYRNGQYRAAQSTATITFDVILNDVIDMKSLRAVKGSERTTSATAVRRYTRVVEGVDMRKVPLRRVPLYTLLMLPIIGHMLVSFEYDNKDTYVNDASRHMATHTVSARQYKKSNALLTIMTVASICKVTEVHGRHWLQASFEAYGLRLNDS